MSDYQAIVNFIRSLYGGQDFIPLHEPRFMGHEKQYVADAIDSTFVSSVGQYVDLFEQRIAERVGSQFAIATVNGTAALHIALLVAGVKHDHQVITQPLTFVATCNAVSYIGAHPVFVDVDKETMGLSPDSLRSFLEQHCECNNDQCFNKHTGRIVKACVPMHTFGHPCRIDEIQAICKAWNIELVEDAAESLGSYYKGQHTGTFGTLGMSSFNGNKIITAGGGGVIFTDDEILAKQAKHLSTTAKVPENYAHAHDQIGYNYRMPNLNAALLVGQLENLDSFLQDKKELTQKYQEFFADKHEIEFVTQPEGANSNYWLQAVMLSNKKHKDEFLSYTNEHGIMTRPVWKLMNKLKMFEHCQSEILDNAEYLEQKVVNIPSGVRI